MATVVDALVVTLGLDSSNFVAGQDKARKEITTTKEVEKKRSEASVAGSKEMERAASGVVNAYARVRNEILALFGVLLAGKGLKQFLADLNSSDAAMGYTAKSIGIATKELAAWQKVAENTGGSAQGISNALGNISQKLAEAKIGKLDEGFSSALDSIGVTAVDVRTGHYKSPNELAKEIGEKLNNRSMPDAIAKGAQLGIDAQTVQVIRRSQAEMNRLLQEQKSRGLPDDADAKRAQELANTFRNIKTDIEQIFREFEEVFFPDLEKQLKSFDDYLKAHKEEWKAYFKEVEERIAAMIAPINEVAKALGGWNVVMEGFLLFWVGEKFTKMLGGMALMRGNIVGLALALGTLALTDETFDKWIYAHIPGASWLGDLLADLFGIKGGQNNPFVGPDNAPLTGPKQNLQGQDRNLSFLEKHPDNWGDLVNWGHVGNNLQKGWRWLTGKSPVSNTVPNEGKALLDAIAVGEHNDKDGPYSDDLNPQSGARGRYQFLASTWAEVSKQTGLTEWTPENQDRNAWFYAQQMYRKNTGRDLSTDLKGGVFIGSGLNKTWTSLPGGAEHNAATDGFNQRLWHNLQLQAPAVVTPLPTPANRNQQQPTPGNNITIGDVHIHSNAKDATQLAQDFKNEVQRRMFAMQLNRGLA